MKVKKEMLQTTPPMPIGFSSDQLMKALRDVEDLIERTLCPYLLLGDTALDIKDNLLLHGSKITVGIENKYLTKEALSTLQTLLKNVEITEKGFTYMVGEVPVQVKFIRKKYGFFKYPDAKMYWGGEYKIPNPFDKYWKSRRIIA